MVYQDTITVACANIHPLAFDRSANLAKFKSFVERAASKGANLIIFPETSLTAMPELAETIPGDSTDELSKEAQRHNIYVVAGLWEKDKSNPNIIYNSAVLIDPEGVVGIHRKVHLFEVEKPYIAPGEEWSVFETRYGPIGILICTELYKFPEPARICALKGARLIAVPVASPVTIPNARGNLTIFEGLIEGGTAIIKVRAFDNQIYIAVANRVGCAPAPGMLFFGKSMIVGSCPPGSATVRFFAGPAKQNEDELIMASLDLKSMDEARGLLFKDRLPQAYGAITQS
jgi:predicted amidohydrolase